MSSFLGRGFGSGLAGVITTERSGLFSKVLLTFLIACGSALARGAFTGSGLLNGLSSFLIGWGSTLAKGALTGSGS